ncbi:class I SAM-dependent DNA methyltransferase [Luteimonas changyuni]|uniref:class I SAM-dependent DNA methyltransferase n=1 Tax=Luteimonas sp. MJ145 TaxID=3129234 RepID=UPI0031BAECBC
MPLSLNEIRDRARAFAREWDGETSERAEAQSFWNDFFHVFGKKRRSVAVYEQKARRFTGTAQGRIDLFWPGVMLAEHKSAGVDLDAAFDQATDYFAGLKESEKPQYILVSDFQRFRLYDLDGREPHVEFPLADLHREIGRFGFISGYQTRTYKEEDPVNVQAAERMGRLYDALKAAGYDGHALEVLLVRLLFCLFADDTGIFPRHALHDLIDQRTSEDGADLGGWLARLFQVLDTPEDRRQTTLDEQLAELPYVNGRLFEERLPLADFNAAMRQQLLDASALDWSRISPAIFGSMFQSVMDAKARRNLGAHYTSEKNILKLIGPLFLDGLKDELGKARQDPKKLAQLHRKLATLRFLDPACGCGNFLVIAYRELRLLELEILKRQFATQQSVLAHVQDHVLVDVDQFHGIEIEEFPAQIAQVAMWLMDHQMNLRVAEQFGETMVRLPLKKSAAIVHGNALRVDWNEVVGAGELDYILGNPPFIGHHYQSVEQKQDQAKVMHEIRAQGVLDFVGNWYVKTADYIQANPRMLCAFVSTNSITQGEQVGLLWPLLLSKGIRINFAHRTFQWNNEARGNAAVHCVIIGFGLVDSSPKLIFDYESPKAEPSVIVAANINPYLVDAPDVVITNRSAPLCDVPKMSWGNKPTDGGHLILSPEERAELLEREPGATRFVRRYMSGGDFINGIERYCLWLNDATPQELKSLPEVMKRVENVRQSRLASKAPSTREYAKYPTRFRQISQPSSDYLAVPEVSSERRVYLPIAFLGADVICSNKIQFVPDASPYHFGVLSSAMHVAWVRAVCGRLKSDFSYSNTIVYNNFPWPNVVEEKHRAAINIAAGGVLDARASFLGSTLADLYDPLTMPAALVRAHQQLDKAVDVGYLAAEKAAGRKTPKLGTDAERVAFLFERHQQLVSLLPTENRKRVARRGP